MDQRSARIVLIICFVLSNFMIIVECKVLLVKNPYKRTDVFVCGLQAHGKFADKVSAYHVLKAKQCFPQGCLYFRWSCSRKNKGLSCKRGYQFVGRLCEGCSFYQDSKQHLQPKLVLSDPDYQAFLRDVEEFDEWLQTVKDREVATAFRINAVKPRFLKEVDGDHGRVRLSGYLLNMEEGFIDREFFQDPFFAITSPGQQEQYKFAPGDEVEARATIKMDRGRLLLTRLRSVHFESRSSLPTWNNSKALVAKAAASYFPRQATGCLLCPHGALVDVTETVRNQVVQRRDLYCLAGMPDQTECYLYALHKVDLCHHRS